MRKREREILEIEIAEFKENRHIGEIFRSKERNIHKIRIARFNEINQKSSTKNKQKKNGKRKGVYLSVQQTKSSANET